MTDDVTARLEYLRGEIDAERISYSELAELQGLADRIDPGDTQLLEWAGVPEFPAGATIPPQTGPEGEVRAYGIRYLIGVGGDDEDGWDWSVESLPTDYAGCDGLCTYGCGADPWELVADGVSWDYADALATAHAERDRIIESRENTA